jgi:uncharacterized protein
MKFNLPALYLSFVLTAPCYALAENAPPDQAIGIIVGDAEWMAEANLIAKNLAHEDGLRVLPIMGAGGIQALQDLNQLPHVDAALVSSDSLVYAQQQKLVTGKIAYIAQVAQLNVILIARQGLNNVTALAGKRIATGPAESSGFATGELLFGALELPFIRVPQQGDSAIAALLGGKADAALVLGDTVAKQALNDPRFHVLSLPLPPQLAQTYVPVKIVFKKQTTETLATSLTLAVVDWPRGSPRANVLKRFEKQLFKANEMPGDVAGWTRHFSALDALKETTSIIPTGAQP